MKFNKKVVHIMLFIFYNKYFIERNKFEFISFIINKLKV